MKQFYQDFCLLEQTQQEDSFSGKNLSLFLLKELMSVLCLQLKSKTIESFLRDLKPEEKKIVMNILFEELSLISYYCTLEETKDKFFDKYLDDLEGSYFEGAKLKDLSSSNCGSCKKAPVTLKNFLFDLNELIYKIDKLVELFTFSSFLYQKYYSGNLGENLSEAPMTLDYIKENFFSHFVFSRQRGRIDKNSFSSVAMYITILKIRAVKLIRELQEEVCPHGLLVLFEIGGVKRMELEKTQMIYSEDLDKIVMSNIKQLTEVLRSGPLNLNLSFPEKEALEEFKTRRFSARLQEIVLTNLLEQRAILVRSSKKIREIV